MDREQLKALVKQAVMAMRSRAIPLGISNRHLHLSKQDFDVLFPNQPMTEKKALLQPGQYATDQVVTLVGPKGSIKNVRVLGPVRSRSQVEVSATDARGLGIKVPLRLSGDLAGTPGITLISQFGEVTLDSGVIIAKRHIHMSPMDALIYGVKHGDSVSVAISGTPRGLTFDDVSVRVSDDMRLEMHIDTDEANAAGADMSQATATLLR
jgi:phosphate propanoyltransferase